MSTVRKDPFTVIRRSKLFIPVNREKFVAKAWTRGADCLILDLEDSIPPAEKSSARRMVKDVIPLVKKGGAEIEVRINRDYEEEDLAAVVGPEVASLMIPKCESAEELRRLDRRVAQLEKERGVPEGRTDFSLLIETARGVVRMEEIVAASPRIVQASIGGVDLTQDMGFTRVRDLLAEQFSYPAGKLLYAARAAGVQAAGLWPQNNVDFTDTTLSYEAMLHACRRSFQMGYLGSSTIHPAWVRPLNEGFKPSASELDWARRVKVALEEAYSQGLGSVAVDGRMVDVANLKQVQKILERAEAIDRREAEKETAMAATGGRA